MKKSKFLHFLCEKQIVFILILIAGLTLVSCGDDEMLDGDSFGWEKVSYRSKEIRGVNYYVVPQRGGDYTFIMKLSGTEGMKVTCKNSLAVTLHMDTSILCRKAPSSVGADVSHTTWQCQSSHHREV